MIGQTDSQLSDNSEPVSIPGGEQVTDANVTTVGVKRGEFPDGDATVLVLDHFKDTWEHYERRVPQECNLLFVRDTESAEQAMRENPAIGVVIAQGLSRKATHWMVDAIDLTSPNAELVLMAWLAEQQRKGDPVNDWLDSHQHTLAFLKFLQQQGFGGLVQVVSRTLKSYYVSEMLELKNLRVQYMNKHDFFLGTFTGKVDGLWERIARYERYERKTGRKLSPNTGVGRHFDQLLTQAVYPHPAEDRLYERWEQKCLSWYRGFSFEQPEARAFEEAVMGLEELKAVIATGDIRTIYSYASQMPQNRDNCECREFNDPADGYFWARYLHLTHVDLNLAVWEILDMAGLSEWMRLELEFDLTSRHPECERYGWHIRLDYGRQLREFFQPEGPSERWAGWRASRRH